MFREKINVPVVTLGDWAYSEGAVRADFSVARFARRGACGSARRLQDLAHVSFILRSVAQTDEGAPLYPEFRTWMEAWGFGEAREELSSSDMGNSGSGSSGVVILVLD
jgi:hypothetical protein